MSQAHALSRRSMLAGASTVAAFTTFAAVEVPQICGTSIKSNADHPDAELLALAERFDPLYAAWCKQRAADHLEQFQFEIAIEQATGVKLIDVPDVMSAEGSPEQLASHAYWRARTEASNPIFRARTPQQRNEEQRKESEFGALKDALDELAADILMFNPDTREGLALLTKAMIIHTFDTIEPTIEWNGKAEDDWLRCFIESVCSFAGVPFPPYRSHVAMLLDREG